MRTYLIFVWIILMVSVAAYGQSDTKKKVTHDFGLELEGEYRHFFKDAQFTGQESSFPAFSIRPEYTMSWNDGYDNIQFAGFFRWDRDKARTHADIRELYYQKAKGNWELNLGIKKIYWGVIESNHLVDVVNQTDQVETFDGEQKLGQPMAQFSLATQNTGTFEFFYLPYHRRRTLAGEAGRLRFGTVIDMDDIGYENDNEEWQPSFAFRWSHYIGIFDLGLSHFYGAGREPVFAFSPSGDINAFYPVIHQSGIDIQITHDAFLWKIESIYRQADIDNFFAAAAGVEYTFSNVNGKGLDIGVLAEYSYDERDAFALTNLQNDLFLASRMAFNDINDTAILFGGIVDLDHGSMLYSLEASRRFWNDWTIVAEARIFSNIASEEFILSSFQNDSFMRLSVSRFF